MEISDPKPPYKKAFHKIDFDSRLAIVDHEVLTQKLIGEGKDPDEAAFEAESEIPEVFAAYTELFNAAQKMMTKR